MKFVASAALILLLAGCAGSNPTTPATADTSSIVGDEKGGRIANGVSNLPASNAAMRAFCAQYSKRAFITQMAPADEGGLLVFQCV
jgi:hypothetical protein